MYAEMEDTREDAAADTATRARRRILSFEYVEVIPMPTPRPPLLTHARGPILEEDELLWHPRMSIHGAEIVILRRERPDERQRREQCERVGPLMATIKQQRQSASAAVA